MVGPCETERNTLGSSSVGLRFRKHGTTSKTHASPRTLLHAFHSEQSNVEVVSPRNWGFHSPGFLGKRLNKIEQMWHTRIQHSLLWDRDTTLWVSLLWEGLSDWDPDALARDDRRARECPAWHSCRALAWRFRQNFQQHNRSGAPSSGSKQPAENKLSLE